MKRFKWNELTMRYEKYYDYIFSKSNNKKLSEAIAVLYLYVYTSEIVDVFSGKYNKRYSDELKNVKFKKFYDEYYQYELIYSYKDYKSDWLIAFYAIQYAKTNTKRIEEGHETITSTEFANTYSKAYGNEYFNNSAEEKVAFTVRTLMLLSENKFGKDEILKDVLDIFNVPALYALPILSAIKDSNYDFAVIKELTSEWT